MRAAAAALVILMPAICAAQTPSQVLPPSGTFSDSYGSWTFGAKLPSGDYPICLGGNSTNGAGILLQYSGANYVSAWTGKGFWQTWNGSSFSNGVGTAGQSCGSQAPPLPTKPTYNSSISWVPGLDLSRAKVYIASFNVPVIITGVACKTEVPVGGNALLTVSMVSPTGVSTILQQCNANLGVTASLNVSVPANTDIVAMASGAGWPTSVGSGGLTIFYQQ